MAGVVGGPGFARRTAGGLVAMLAAGACGVALAWAL